MLTLRLSALDGEPCRDDVLARATAIDPAAGTYELTREAYREMAAKWAPKSAPARPAATRKPCGNCRGL